MLSDMFFTLHYVLLLHSDVYTYYMLFPAILKVERLEGRDWSYKVYKPDFNPGFVTKSYMILGKFSYFPIHSMQITTVRRAMTIVMRKWPILTPASFMAHFKQLCVIKKFNECVFNSYSLCDILIGTENSIVNKRTIVCAILPIMVLHRGWKDTIQMDAQISFFACFYSDLELELVLHF